MKRLAFLFLLVPAAFASWNAEMQLDVRTTGNDANGGGFDSTVTSPGTDYSMQDNPAQTYTDIVIGATTTQATSALHPFGADVPGNIVHITGGTGCTAGWFEAKSLSGSTITFDRSLGTAASTCTGNLGGSFATPGGTATAMGVTTVTTNGVTVNIKSGTYTLTSSVVPQGGASVGGLAIAWIGYGTNHGDLGTRPLITSSTNSLSLVVPESSGSSFSVDNVNFSHTAATRGYCIQNNSPGGAASGVVIKRAVFDGCYHALEGNFSVEWNWPSIVLVDVEVKNSTDKGIYNDRNGTYIVLYHCYIHNNGNYGLDVGGATSAAFLIDSIFASNSAAGVHATGAGVILHAYHSVFYSNTGAGLDASGVSSAAFAGTFFLENNIFYGNTTYGIDTQAPQSGKDPGAYWWFVNRNNAYGSNSTAARHNVPAGAGDITLTADPFTNAGSADFSLNSTAGGGPVLKAAGYPGVAAFGTGNIDIGPLQTGSTAAQHSFAHVH